MSSGVYKKKISVEEYKARKASKGASEESNPPQQGEHLCSSNFGKSSHHGNRAGLRFLGPGALKFWGLFWHMISNIGPNLARN